MLERDPATIEACVNIAPKYTQHAHTRTHVNTFTKARVCIFPCFLQANETAFGRPANQEFFHGSSPLPAPSATLYLFGKNQARTSPSCPVDYERNCKILGVLAHPRLQAPLPPGDDDEDEDDVTPVAPASELRVNGWVFDYGSMAALTKTFATCGTITCLRLYDTGPTTRMRTTMNSMTCATQ